MPRKFKKSIQQEDENVDDIELESEEKEQQRNQQQQQNPKEEDLLYKPNNLNNKLVSQQPDKIIKQSTFNDEDAMQYEREIMELDLYPKLQNIVATVNLCCQLDLKQIALQARNAEYNPKRFAAVIMRLRDPKTTALIFSSGKMVCTGAKTEEDSNKASRKYAKIIQKLGFTDVKFTEFKIQNIVGSTDVKFPINLDNLEQEYKSFVQYEPEIFPGLIYREHSTKIVLLIFVSGKIVLTGAKNREKIVEAFKKIYAVLKQFMKKDYNNKSNQKAIQNPVQNQITNNNTNIKTRQRSQKNKNNN